MEVKSVLTEKEQKQWDAVQQKRGASFSQSSWWGAFRASTGNKVWFMQDDHWAAVAIESRTPLGMYWLVPYGPTADSKQDMKAACQALVTQAKAAGAIYLRIEPQQADFFDSKGFRKAPASFNPEHTIVMDLTQSDDELMANMKQNNRSLVRKADREGVTFKRSNQTEDIDVFYKMQQHISSRTGAVFHPLSYYQRQAEQLMPGGHMAVELAYSPNGQPLATLICHDYAGKTTYTHAAASDAAKEYDAGRFLVFHSMLAAKKRGQTTYDLYGIAGPDADSNDPWHGFTFFKRQFGGQQVAYAGTWDKPLIRSRYLLLRTRASLVHRRKRLKQIRKRQHKA